MSSNIYRVSYIRDYSLNTLYFKANNKAEAKEEFLKKYTDIKESQIANIELLGKKSFDFSNYFKQIISDKAIRTFAIAGLLLAGAYFGAKMYGEYKRQKLVAEFEEEHKAITPNEIQQSNEEEIEPTPLNNPSDFADNNPSVEFRAKIHKNKKQNNTPLHSKELTNKLFDAISHNNLSKCKKLLDKGADINRKDDSLIGETPLINALNMGYLDIANMLIDRGANVNAKTRLTQLTALHYAVSSGNKNIVEKLLNKGADVNAKNFDGINPPICNANYEIAKLLIEHGAKVNVLCSERARKDTTLLQRAVEKDDFKIAELFLKHGENANIKLDKGQSLLNLARSDKMRNLLIPYMSKTTADLFIKNMNFRTGLNLKIVNKKISDKACKNPKLNKGCIEYTIEYPYVKSGKNEAIVSILNKGINTIIKKVHSGTAQEFVNSSIKENFFIHDFEEIIRIKLKEITQKQFVLYVSVYSYMGQPRPAIYEDIYTLNMQTGEEITANKNPNKDKKEHISSSKIKMDINYKIIGSKVYFKVSAINTFSNAKGGISVSIPSLRYDKDIYTINQSGFDSAKVYPSGSSLWSGSLKRKITGSYVLIEGWSNKWHSNTQKSLEFSIDKNLIANKSVNIRAVLVKNRQEYLLPTSGATDQQGYPVEQITVNVAGGSNSVSSENKQNYESTQNSGDKAALEQVLNSWNKVMNNKDTSRLEYLYASEIKYYGKHYARSNAIKDKQRALSKYPEFSQQIKNITYEEITQNLYKVSFDKYVKASPTSQEKLYPSYLYIKKINGEWRIVEESDKVTDRILQERSSNNASKGLFVCYDKKEIDASGVHYIGCQRFSTPCNSNNKLHFGKYSNSSDAQNALNRCKNSKPKFIDSGKRASVDDGDFYIARISRKDHYNKWGKKLTKVADILQQDRANFYKFNKNDIEDFADVFFFKKENRFKIRKMLENGYISNKTAYQIINGTPLIKVDIYKNSLNVSLYHYGTNANQLNYENSTNNRKTALNVPVMIGGEPDEDACGGTGEIRGISRYGDGYVAVRSGPGTKYKIIDKIYRNGMHVAMCDTNGKWEGVVYGNGKCGTGSPVPKPQPYKGKCKSGWIYKQYVKLIAE